MWRTKVSGVVFNSKDKGTMMTSNSKDNYRAILSLMKKVSEDYWHRLHKDDLYKKWKNRHILLYISVYEIYKT